MIPALEIIDDTTCELRVRHNCVLVNSETDPSLKRDGTAGCYAIIRYNSRTYQSDGVLVVVRGKETADSELKRFEECQDSSDRHEGWRYFIEKTDLKAGTDPAAATRHRQAELEARELKALQEDETPIAVPEKRDRKIFWLKRVH